MIGFDWFIYFNKSTNEVDLRKAFQNYKQATKSMGVYILLNSPC